MYSAEKNYRFSMYLMMFFYGMVREIVAGVWWSTKSDKLSVLLVKHKKIFKFF